MQMKCMKKICAVQLMARKNDDQKSILCLLIFVLFPWSPTYPTWTNGDILYTPCLPHLFHVDIE